MARRLAGLALVALALVGCQTVDTRATPDAIAKMDWRPEDLGRAAKVYLQQATTNFYEGKWAEADAAAACLAAIAKRWSGLPETRAAAADLATLEAQANALRGHFAAHDPDKATAALRAAYATVGNLRRATGPEPPVPPPGRPSDGPPREGRP